MLKRKEKQQKQREGNGAIVDGDPLWLLLCLLHWKNKWLLDSTISKFNQQSIWIIVQPNKRHDAI
jgi:hypothetical protein